MNYLVAFYTVESGGASQRVGRSYVFIPLYQRTQARLEELERDLCLELNCAGIVIINLMALDGGGVS
jgi:hypothetical protein